MGVLDKVLRVRADHARLRGLARPRQLFVGSGSALATNPRMSNGHQCLDGRVVSRSVQMMSQTTAMRQKPKRKLSMKP